MSPPQKTKLTATSTSTLRELFQHPYLGHKELLQRTESMIAAEQMPQLTLLHGVEGIGKRYLLARIAQQLICNHHRGDEQRQQRTSNLICHAQHPDLWSAPYPGALTKEHANELQAHLALRSLSGGARVVICAEVERLSTARINQLLKVLEEPPQNSFILLSSSRKSALLPTLISRCFLWHVPPLQEDVFSQVLKRAYAAAPLDDAQISSLAHATGGSVSEALFRLEQDAIITSLQEILTCSDPLKAWSLVDALSLGDEWSARDLLYAVERALNGIYSHLEGKTPLHAEGILTSRRQLLRRHHHILRHHDLALNKSLFLKALVAAGLGVSSKSLSSLSLSPL